MTIEEVFGAFCPACDEELPDEEDLFRRYDCGNCGEFVASPEDGNRCPECNKFSSRVGSACPNCEDEIDEMPDTELRFVTPDGTMHGCIGDAEQWVRPEAVEQRAKNKAESRAKLDRMIDESLARSEAERVERAEIATRLLDGIENPFADEIRERMQSEKSFGGQAIVMVQVEWILDADGLAVKQRYDDYLYDEPGKLNPTRAEYKASTERCAPNDDNWDVSARGYHVDEAAAICRTVADRT